MLEPRFAVPVPIDVQTATQIQRELGKKIVVKPLPNVKTVAALDACYIGHQGCGAAVLTDCCGISIASAVSDVLEVAFPYVPGYLAFREAPVLAAALKALPDAPDCLLVEGHGIWHPRRCGLASFMGLLYDIPSIGCTKKPFKGHWTTPGPQRGDWTPVMANGELVGATLRTRERTAPVWVTPGHLSDVESAVELILALSRTRLPEPLKVAHRMAASAAKSSTSRWP